VVKKVHVLFPKFGEKQALRGEKKKWFGAEEVGFLEITDKEKNS